MRSGLRDGRPPGGEWFSRQEIMGQESSQDMKSRSVDSWIGGRGT